MSALDDGPPLSIIAGFIRQERPEAAAVPLDASLIDEGILDSMLLLQLVAFLEARFGVAIPLEEVTPDNFETLASMDRLIRDKQAAPGTGGV